MTRLELLQLLVGQARSNGFEFRKWYTGRLGMTWHGSQKAIELLSNERRYYALIFSHEFAQAFWKPGEDMVFQVPSQSFQRRMRDGSIGTVVRKGYTRRRTREDVWLYHLREMAASEEPLRYLRRFLRVAEDLVEEPTASPGEPASFEVDDDS